MKQDMSLELSVDEGAECTFNMYHNDEGSFLRISKGERAVWYAAVDNGWLLLNAVGLEVQNNALEFNFQQRLKETLQ